MLAEHPIFLNCHLFAGWYPNIIIITIGNIQRFSKEHPKQEGPKRCHHQAYCYEPHPARCGFWFILLVGEDGKEQQASACNGEEKPWTNRKAFKENVFNERHLQKSGNQAWEKLAEIEFLLSEGEHETHLENAQQYDKNGAGFHRLGLTGQ